MSTHEYSLKVLYEDNHLIAVFKPARVPTQGDASRDKTLMDTTKLYLKQKYQKPGEVFLGLLHRLDRPAQGVVLFAKTSKGASRLSEQFRNRTVKKTYEVLVEGQLQPRQGALVGTLDGQRAELEYSLIEAGKSESLVRVNLKTGRKHQIRKQFSGRGHPVAGDTRYGSQRPFAKGAIALCARALEFSHPTQPETRISIELPKELCQLSPK